MFKNLPSQVLYLVFWGIAVVLLMANVVIVHNWLLLVWDAIAHLVAPEYSWQTANSLAWWREFFDRALWLILACIAVSGSVLSEYYLRLGLEDQTLGKRAFRLLGIAGAIAFLGSPLLTLS